MASELSKLMRQYGVTSASMALPAEFKGTVVNEPTAPDAPVAPDDFTLKAPVVTDYGLTAGTKAKPTKLAKGQTQADLDAAQKSWAEYQTALDDYTAQKNAYDATKKTYDTYVSGDIKNKNSYAYKQNQYQTALGDYKTYLDKKADFDANKGDIYNTYKNAYQERIAQTPMYLQQQFTHAPNANPYEGLYSPYGSIDNYNKTGTFWNNVVGDPTYTGEYKPYIPLYQQKGFKDQQSYEATLPTWQQQGYGSELQYLDAKNSNDGLTRVPNTNVNTTPSLTDLANKNGVTNTNATGNTTTGVSTIVGATGNDVITNNISTPSFTFDDYINPATRDFLISSGRTSTDPKLASLVNWSAQYENTPDYVKKFGNPLTNTTPTLTDLTVKNGVTNSVTDNGYVPPSLNDIAKAQNNTATVLPMNTPSSFVGPVLNGYAPTSAPQTVDLSGMTVTPKNGVNMPASPFIGPVLNTSQSRVSQPNVMQQAKMTPWDSMGITQDDYYENYYAKGGSVHGMARKYAVGGDVDIANSAMPNPEAGIPQPVEAPVAVQAPPSDNMAKMQEMLQAYGTPANDYAQELEEARRKSNAENEAFMDMFKKARHPENDNLSQAELFFRLAAAAGAPTKTGGITESLSNINKEMADYSKEQTGRRNSDLELQMKAQQLKAANAKEDLNVLRGLAGESMKDKRAIISEMIKAEIPKAQSEAGKLALDMGLRVGTPEYQQFVTNNGMQLLQAKVNQMLMAPSIAAQNAATSAGQLNVAQGNLAENQARTGLEIQKWQEKQKEGEKLTPNDRKVLWEKEDTLTNLQNAQKMIEQAYDLNDIAYTGNVFDIAKQKYGETFSPEDPTVVNTGKLINLLSTESLSRMKDVFGSNPTEGERAAQSQLSGALAKSKEVRKDIMLNYMEQLQKRIALEKRRLKQLQEGTSRDLPNKEDAQ